MALKLSCCALALLLCACAEDSDFSHAESQTLFDDANGELHALHLETLALPEWPATYSWVCAEGGTIEMTTATSDDGTITALAHTFEACTLGGRTLDGTLDYQNVTTLDCSGSEGFAFDIRGELSVAGDAGGECLMKAREVCGEFTGSTCGYEI